MDILNEVENINLTIDTIIERGAKQFDKIPVEFADRKEEAKLKLINDARKSLTENIKSQLQHLQEKTENLADENEIQMQKVLHPMRISELRKEERIIAEQQFRSALALLNTKNETMLLNELRRSVLNNSRNEFNYTILENIQSFGFSDKLIDNVIEIMKKNSYIQHFVEYAKIEKEIEAIQDKLNYHLAHLEAGAINRNYNLNREFRTVAGAVR